MHFRRRYRWIDTRADVVQDLFRLEGMIFSHFIESKVIVAETNIFVFLLLWSDTHSSMGVNQCTGRSQHPFTALHPFLRWFNDVHC